MKFNEIKDILIKNNILNDDDLIHVSTTGMYIYKSKKFSEDLSISRFSDIDEKYNLCIGDECFENLTLNQLIDKIKDLL